jgi:subtilisin-like proprotein convertase family protein
MMNRYFRVSTGLIMLLLLVCGLFQAQSPLQLTPSTQSQRTQNGSSGFSLNQNETPNLAPSGPIVSETVIPDVSPLLREITPATPEIALDRELNPRMHPGDLLNGVPLLPDGEPDPLADSSQNFGDLTPPVSLSFDGISYATGGTGSPPDTVGAVGPNHYVQMVNGSIQIFNKSGTSIFGPVLSNTIWSGFGGNCQTRNDGDPIVLYDRQADRWLVAQFTIVSPYYICAAVSTTADPTGSYYRYAFNVGSNLPDYFKFGVWPDAYYMSANESTYTAYAFNRTAMLAGAAATYVKFTGQTNLLMPADLDGATAPPAGSPGIFYTFKDNTFHGGSDRLEVFNLTVNWASPGSSTFTLVNTVPVTSFTYTVCGFFNLDCIPQPGATATQRLDPVSEWPMFRLAYRNFGTHQSLAGNFAVDVGSDRAGIRWFELRRTGVGAWSLYQEGTQAPADGVHRWMGSIAQDRQGNIALGYSASSGTLNPSIRYATRLASDPLGTLQSEVTLHAGGGIQTSSHSRWGDYSAMDVDPSNDCTFWYTTEYFSASGSQWRTRIGTFTIPECVAVPDYTLTTGDTVLNVCNPGSDSSSFTLGAQNGYAGNVTLSTTGLPAGASASFSVNPVTVPGSSDLTVTTAGTGAGSYPFIVNSTDGTLSHPQAMTLNVTAAAPSAPTLLSLANGTTGASTTPTLSWQAVAGSTNYILEISTSPTFSTLAYSINVAATSHVVATTLSNDTLYYWRVRAAANICGSGANSAVWAFTTVSTPTTLPAICRNPGTAIPDNNPTGITDSMVVATTGTLTDLNVSLNIPHTYVGDLIVSLLHVDTATTVSLVNRPVNGAGACSGNNINLTLDSSAALQVQVNCTSGANPTAAYTVGGSYQPAATLNAFNGQNLSGTWQLQVSDRAGVDLGTLNQWCLIPTVTGTPAARDYSDLDSGYGVAWHTGNGSLRLGSSWTADTTFTLGNDDGSDDGIVKTGGQWVTGNTVTLNATITGGSGYLAGWFDWNNDGLFSAGEKAVAQNVVAGVNTVNLTVGPYNPGSTPTLKARFRLYATEPTFGPNGTETPDGGATTGEVEDYAWAFSPTAISLQTLGLMNPFTWGLGLVLGLVGVTGWVLWRRIRFNKS